MSNKIKWCAIQPLTGGMYLGTEKAVGCKAEFILSYPGVGDPKIDKESGDVLGGGNEYHLMTLLTIDTFIFFITKFYSFNNTD